MDQGDFDTKFNDELTTYRQALYELAIHSHQTKADLFCVFCKCVDQMARVFFKKGQYYEISKEK